MPKSMSLNYQPSSEPLHNSAKQLFLNQELYLVLIEGERREEEGLEEQGERQAHAHPHEMLRLEPDMGR